MSIPEFTTYVYVDIEKKEWSFKSGDIDHEKRIRARYEGVVNPGVIYLPAIYHKRTMECYFTAVDEEETALKERERIAPCLAEQFSMGVIELSQKEAR